MKLLSKKLFAAAAVTAAPLSVLAQTPVIDGLEVSDLVLVFTTNAVPYIAGALPVLFVLAMVIALIHRLIKGGKKAIPRA